MLDAGEWGTTDAMANKEAETVNSKYVVVKMQAENCSDFQTEWNASGGNQHRSGSGIHEDQ